MPTPIIPLVIAAPPQVTQWNLKKWPGANVVKAWEISKGNPDFTLAIVDLHLDPSNLALDGENGCPSRGFQNATSSKYPCRISKDLSCNHGTYVTQIAAACPHSGQSYYGVDWLSKVLFLDHDSSVEQTFNSILHALDDQIKADVINFSSGSKDSSRADQLTWLDGASQVVARRGVVVTTSGNSAVNASTQFPAALPGFITVGATDKNGDAWAFSNWGTHVDIMAPGADISLYDGKGQLTKESGTSLAAPLVSGVVLLAKDQYLKAEPKKPWNWKIARHILRKTAVSMTCNQYCSFGYDAMAWAKCRTDCCDASGKTQHCTAGSVDAFAAVLEAQKGCPNAFLIDADKYLVRMKKNADGLYVGDFLMTNVGCGTAVPDIAVKITQHADAPATSAKSFVEFDYIASDLPEGNRLVMTQKEKGDLPKDFEVHFQIKWKADDKLHDELQIVAIPES
jgi:hypothetical protein